MNNKNKGLYGKYKVERVDGKEIKNGCIVLELKDPNSRKGIRAFSNAVLMDGYTKLSDDLDCELRKYGENEAGFDLGINEIADKNWLFCEKNNWHNKTTLEHLALICSEVGEAVNECRDVRPNYNLRYELADIVLRVADLSKHLGIDLGMAIKQKMEKNKDRDFSHKVY